MLKQILCLVCGEREPLTKIDRENGWQDRKVQIKALVRPENHGIIYTNEREKTFSLDRAPQPSPEVYCNNCNVALHNGYPAIAYTRWRIWDEDEPAPWEFQFGAFDTRPDWSRQYHG